MQYCPVCGGRLPPSHRADLFAEMDEQEIQECERRLAHLRTLDAIIAVLGRPDDDRTFSSDFQMADKQRYGVEIVRRVLTYSSVARTFDVSVQETASGEISISFVPREHN
jgi:hypothetical protein